VSDAARATLLAAERESRTFAFNVGGGARATLNEVFGLVERICGRMVARTPGEWQKGDVRDTWADCSAAKEELGYEPRMPLAEGLERLVEWYRRTHAVEG
jgi:UDP-glucose 4-epimerase